METEDPTNEGSPSNERVVDAFIYIRRKLSYGRKEWKYEEQECDCTSRPSVLNVETRIVTDFTDKNHVLGEEELNDYLY